MPQQRRHKTRRRTRGRFPGLYKAVSAVLILAAVVAACAVFFRVGEIQVTGNSRYTAQEIIDVTGIQYGDNLFMLDRAKLARELRSRLPYIRTVSIRRALPDGVVISVTEGQAVAAVAHEGRWWLMDSAGKLLESVPTAGDHATITGISPLAPAAGTSLATAQEQRPRLERLRELLSALEKNRLLDKLDSVDLSKDHQIVLGYDGRFTVELSVALESPAPGETGLSYWLRRFAAAMNDPGVSPNQHYRVDISDNQTLHFIPE